MDVLLRLKRKILFSYRLSWHYGPFNESKRCWERKFEFLAFAKALQREIFGLKHYKFIWDKEKKIYIKTALTSEEEKRPIPWTEYCRTWREANPEWMAVVEKHSWVGVRYGTENERKALNNELEALRKKGLPRESQFRVLENLKMKSAKPQKQGQKYNKLKKEKKIETVDDLAKVSKTFAKEMALKQKRN